MTEIRDRAVFLDRMAKSLKEKLKVSRFIPRDARSVLDVGCADGIVTIALAYMFPHIQFMGIDLDEEFIERANKSAQAENLSNVRFECMYLRDLLARPEKFDAVLFVSVLHEFYTYGEGISSVLKALADAHELLNQNGEIVIKDMILHEYSKHTGSQVTPILEKVSGDTSRRQYIVDFEKHFGPMVTLYTLNHFLLKYMYVENWERECSEHYVPVTFEQYNQIFSLLGMDLQFQDSYLIPFLKNKWMKDFRITREEIEFSGLQSTGFMGARKVV